jgi:preprotein translocase subunit SecB
MMDETQPPKIRIAQIFLERASFEHREDSLSFPPGTPISTEAQITLETGLSEDGSKARIRVSACSKPGSEDLYTFNLLMTALIEQEGQGNMPLERYLAASAGALVFPFLREAVANLTGRGRFGPVWLNPVNLVAMAHQQPEPSSLGAVRETISGVSGSDQPKQPVQKRHEGTRRRS